MPFIAHRTTLDCEGRRYYGLASLARVPNQTTILTAADGTCYFATLEPAYALLDGKRGYKVSYVDSDRERANWYTREQRRFNDGTYLALPDWYALDGFAGFDAACQAVLNAHYAHRSLEEPKLVAYTPNAEYGHLDRQVRCKPGRYLEKFYQAVPLPIRQAWLAEFESADFTLQLATTPDDCERVYRGADYPDGRAPFQSCMGPQANKRRDCPDRHAYENAIRSTRVYGNSDLAVAYLGPMDAVVARCVVWPAKRIWTRVYGSNTLRAVLHAAGYTQGDLRGAKVPALATGDRYCMPYVDGADAADLTGRVFVLGRGPYSVKETDGYAGYADDDDDDNRTMTCEYCGEECDYNEESSYCPTCEDERQYCEACEESHWSDSFLHVTDRGYERYICASCRDHLTTACPACDVRWNVCDLSYEDQRTRVRHGLTPESPCPSCQTQIEAGDLHYCEDCDTWHETPTCPEQTANLPVADDDSAPPEEDESETQEATA